MLETYLNPVYQGDFPDPFVLKYCGEYWAYCTGQWKDGRCMGILKSTDLVHWEEVGGAMAPLAENPPYYWAPEVSYYNGQFYLYYSAGNETLMEIRVAVADHPAGPFVDSGRRLTSESFAIDAHVFQDEDGRRYLFYATDYLEHSHIGTGTACDLMLDPFTLAGKPRPVTRARYDWQVYDPNRPEKGGVRWHTVEGPFILKHKGLYYEMFSGGNWKNISYGVSYAISPSLDNPEEWRQVADGVEILPILRTIPGKVIGPGHNSVVRGPDNRQLYCVYHRWAEDGTGRQLAIDPLDWAGERMLVLGPSTEPSLVPALPTVKGFNQSPVSQWSFSGNWSQTGNTLSQGASSVQTEASLKITIPYFVAEVSLRTLADKAAEGAVGLKLTGANGQEIYFQLEPGESGFTIRSPQSDLVSKFKLPPDFNFQAYHLIRLEVAGSQVSVALDEGKRLAYQFAPVDRLSLFTEDCPAAFSGFELTQSWEDLFNEPYPAEVYGWELSQSSENWQVKDQELWVKASDQSLLASKGPLFENYELVLNLRLVAALTQAGGYQIYPAFVSENESGPVFSLQKAGDGWALFCENGAYRQAQPLPASFNPFIHQQFRFRKQGGHLTVRWETQKLLELELEPKPSRVGIGASQAEVAFDMVRVVAIGD